MIRMPIRALLAASLLTVACPDPGAEFRAKANAMAKERPYADWNDANIGWQSWRDGLERAKTEGRAAVVVVSATWCGSCRMFRSRFFDERVVKASRDLVMIHLDQDADPGPSKMMSVDGTYLPRVLVVAPDGRIDRSLVGPAPNNRHYFGSKRAGHLLKLLDEVHSKYPSPSAAGG